MKKLISVVLALMLVLSMSAVAFADEWNGTYAASDATTFKIKKNYDSEGNVQVGETLKFTATQTSGNSDQQSLTVDDLVVANGLTDLEITVHVPSYTKAGVYEYTIKETAGTATGVTYATDSTIYVQVLVEYDNENHKLVIGNETKDGITYFIKKDAEGNKTDKFENTFKSGSFSVAKDVDGNMANETDKFDIIVTLTAPEGKTINTPIEVGGQSVAASAWKQADESKPYVYTTTLTISENDGATTFADIPVGVTVTVAENTAADKMNGYTYESIAVDSTVQKTEGGANAASATITIADNTNSAIVVKNTKESEIITGISMDSMPYVLLMAVAFVGLAMFIGKKRTREF